MSAGVKFDFVAGQPLSTPPYHAMPPRPRHAISTHMPGWDLMLEFAKKEPEFFARFADMYPRFLLHRDIKQLIKTIIKNTPNSTGQLCIPFPSLQSAIGCREFSINPDRKDDFEALSPDEITIRGFEFGASSSTTLRLYAVFFPAEKQPNVVSFWVKTGLGISSRLAEEALNLAGSEEKPNIREFTDLSTPPAPNPQHETASHSLQERIANLLNRAPVQDLQNKVSPGDVYLYQSGMSAIYHIHTTLITSQKWRPIQSPPVMFGFPFHQTPHVFTYWGPGFKFFPLGTEFDLLEEYLQEQQRNNTPVTVLWTEFPSNPLLVSSDLYRLRQLADKYNFIFIIDETISGFCNVDVLPVADIVITSLTKSFSGYADVLGGSAVLNPGLNTERYNGLKKAFDQTYQNSLFHGDVETFLNNTNDYLPRSQILNRNASALVHYLHSLTPSSNSTLTKVFYPPLSPTKAHYDKYKRPGTPTFPDPGYGCLFSVEFETLDATIAFYNHLYVHNGPHLGAHRTLALPYVRLLFSKDLDAVAAIGLNERQIRISVGLEDVDVLLETVKYALEKADETRGREGQGEGVGGQSVEAKS